MRPCRVDGVVMITRASPRLGIDIDSVRATQVIGKIAQLALSTEAEQTPINKEIHHFIQIISAIAFALGISFFAAALGMGQDAVTSLVFMIGIIVANVRSSASRRVHETRGRLTSTSVVSFSSLSHFGPRRGHRCDGVFTKPHRLDDVDAAAT